jgi:hypothetical protein
MEMSQTKMSFFQSGEQEGKIGPIWGLAPMGKRGRCRKVVWESKYGRNIM